LLSTSDLEVINKIKVLVEGIIFYSQYFLNIQITIPNGMYLSCRSWKKNFGFDGSDTEPSSVDPLAISEGKKLDKGNTRASSSLLKKRTCGAVATISNCLKKLREKDPVQAVLAQKALVAKSPPTSIKEDLIISTSSAPSSSAKETREIGSTFNQAKFPKGTRT
jgi:hypothetical protein